MKKKKWSVRRIGYVMSSALVLLFVLFAAWDLFDGFDYYFQDALYQNTRELPTDIVMIAIDDESLGVLGKWPWPRDYHALLLQQLESGEPRVIGVDVLFLEEDQNPEEDDLLVSVLASMKNKPVFAGYAEFPQGSGMGTLQALAYYEPFERIREHVRVAHINTVPDVDGMVRRIPYRLVCDDVYRPGFPFELYRIAYGREPQVSLDEWERMYIRYAGRTGSIEQIPYHMVLSGEVDPEYFREKIVLIGVTAIGLADDYYFTPIDRAYPMYGIEVHANVIQQLHDGLGWQTLPKWAEIAVLIGISLLMTLLYSRMNLLFSTVLMLAVTGSYIGLAVSLSRLSQGYVLSIIYVLATVFLLYVLHNLVSYLSEFLERKRVTDVFSKYMEPRLVDKLLKGGEEALGLGGVKRELTVLFVDIRGFTTMSENLEPEQVVNILNEYLNLCAESIFRYEGTLDKYIGDAAMALFGAPLEMEDHAFRAVQTAYAMQKGSEVLSKKLLEKYGRTVSFGVGVNTGDAIVGNIGASHRLDYTAIGDTVNTAARLESNAKPGQILISSSTYERVKDRVEVRPLGELSVKGKMQTIEVYELIEIKTVSAVGEEGGLQ